LRWHFVGGRGFGGDARQRGFLHVFVRSALPSDPATGGRIHPDDDAIEFPPITAAHGDVPGIVQTPERDSYKELTI
jgi:hypothetical protein